MGVKSSEDFDQFARDYIAQQDTISGLQERLNNITEEENEEIQRLENLHQENLQRVRKKYAEDKKDLEDQLSEKVILREQLSQNMKRKFQDNEEEDVPECPVCMTAMLPPKMIYQCSEGHLVCSDCKSRLQKKECATCRDKNGTSAEIDLQKTKLDQNEEKLILMYQ